MGNRASTVPPPAAPPALLSAAIMGDLEKFQSGWNSSSSSSDADTTAKRLVADRQDNNVLHALFSCRVPSAKTSDILGLIHDSLPTQQLSKLYAAQNHLGCTPLWILVAYGNVPLLKLVQAKLVVLQQQDKDDSTTAKVSEMLVVPNHQGDSPLLATCSQGNTDMVRYLKDDVMSPNQFTAALSHTNQKGTTPLQIVIGNGHVDLLKFLLEESNEQSSSVNVLLQKNAAGLSLFHICAERDFDVGLRLLLEHMISRSNSNNDGLEQVLAVKDKNQANALHVAAFCGNEKAVRVWVDVIQKACGGETAAGVVDLLDRMDGQARTAYWLAMVQGNDTIGTILAETGVDTQHPNMVKEIEEAKQRRLEAAEKRQQQQHQQQNNPSSQPVDGASLLGR